MPQFLGKFEDVVLSFFPFKLADLLLLCFLLFWINRQLCTPCGLKVTFLTAPFCHSFHNLRFFLIASSTESFHHHVSLCLRQYYLCQVMSFVISFQNSFTIVLLASSLTAILSESAGRSFKVPLLNRLLQLAYSTFRWSLRGLED